MKKNKSIQIVLLFLLVLSYLFPSQSLAEHVELPPGIIVGDADGIKVGSDGDYFVHINDVEPGKKWKTYITLSNMRKDADYHLTMFVSESILKQGSLDLSEAIQMRLVLEDQEIYSGPLSGNNGTINLQDSTKPLDLGLFKQGDTKRLVAYFELDGQKYGTKDFREKNIFQNKWHFRGIKVEQDPGDWKDPFLKLPKTGEEWREFLLLISSGLFLVLTILLIMKKKIVK